ncbi:MAG: MBL fold metallo-hydrolase [Actinobacteria bacterium]|nr:MBL fold metallo-hydrolase [Actinomycetota bacterium]
MRIVICGSRGSTPAPGPDFVRYGGHTSCVAIAHDGEDPTLILDAGTGIRRASALFHGRPFRGTLLFGHLHWDHTQGLPFFSAGDNDGARVHALIPEQGDAQEVFARFMSPPHFPIGPDRLRGEWKWDGIDPGVHQIERFEVLAEEIPHKGGRAFGYRISDGTGSIAYLSDHGPVSHAVGPHGQGDFHEAARKICDGADILIHDSQHTSLHGCAPAGLLRDEVRPLAPRPSQAARR